MDLYEAVKRRRSIRKYAGEGLTGAQLDKVEKATKEIKKFLPEIQTGARLVRNGKELQEDISGILADYGKVEAPHYLVLTSEDTPEGYLELGYRYEFLVLTLTSMDIGTCWIGKGFRDEKLANHVNIPRAQTSVTLIALGPLPEGDTLSEIEKPQRKEVKHFLVKNSPDSLTENTLGIIDCLRRAPSALNGQPWRITIEEDRIHLYLKKRSRITKIVLQNLNKLNHVDAGIGLCHLEVGGEKFLEDFEIRENTQPGQERMKYIGTLFNTNSKFY